MLATSSLKKTQHQTANVLGHQLLLVSSFGTNLTQQFASTCVSCYRILQENLLKSCPLFLVPPICLENMFFLLGQVREGSPPFFFIKNFFHKFALHSDIRNHPLFQDIFSMLKSPLKVLSLLLQRKKHIRKNLQHLFKLKDFFMSPQQAK